MKKWLNKEYTVKRKMWTLLFETLIDALIFTMILYFCVTKYNTVIVDLLNNINENNIGFTFTKIMFPIILIIIATLKLGLYVINNSNINSKNKK